MNFMLSLNLLLLILSTFLFFGLAQKALALELGSIGDITSDFTENLNTEIDKFVSKTINDTTSNIVLNSTSAALSNGSNISSRQIIIANNQNVSASANGGAAILNQIENKNGECNSTTVGGPGNDTLSSEGVCNDQLTGGTGADKFICGEGTDTIRDYSPDEGDTIADTNNCEKII